MRDIVTSDLPSRIARFWGLARALSGLAETFSQNSGELAPGGGSHAPEQKNSVEALLFVVKGNARLTIDDTRYTQGPGSCAFLPAGMNPS